MLYRFSPACLHGASSGRALQAPARKVKEKGVMVESARKIGDEWAIVQGGRRAGWQVHPWPGRGQCAWRDYGGSVPSPRKTWGSPGIWTHWEVRPLLCKATSRARSQCHPTSGGAYESRNEEKGDTGTASRVGWNWSSDKDLSPQLPFPPAAFPTSHTLSSSARFWHSDAQLRGGLAKMSLTPRLLRRN